MIERRFSTRLRVGQNGLLLDGDQPARTVKIADISFGGACLQTDFPLAVGAAVKLQVDLPQSGEEREFAARAMVVRAKLGTTGTDYTVGVEFVDMADRHRRHLVRLIHRQ